MGFDEHEKGWNEFMKQAAKKTTRRTGSKSTRKATAGKRAKQAQPREVKLGNRTRPGAIGKWLAKREAAKPGFADEMWRAFRKVGNRVPLNPQEGPAMRVAQVEPREATQH